MIENNFTPTPNIIFDLLLKELSFSELKIILVIIRQTEGWINKKTGKRKERDRVSRTQFIEKTGLSRRSISKAINSLSERSLIVITDKSGKNLNTSFQRQGKASMYYSFSSKEITYALFSHDMCKLFPEHVQKVTYNKRNNNKRNSSKENINDYVCIKEIVETKKSELNSKLKHVNDSSEFSNSDESEKFP
jgi:phage replication O-like protein O